MSRTSDTTGSLATDTVAYLRRHEEKDLLRFLTCGSVDDGKSTLIGRLLYDSKLLFEDQLAALNSESARFGTTGDKVPDLALLVDGLQAEREQGITIDVAYRFFTTDKRKFIVADTPGHQQYTRNMVTGASTADLAILLVDARQGLLEQTYRHATIVSLLGIRHLVLAVNKMDLVGWSADRFDAIETALRDFATRLGKLEITAIPMSALSGDNVTRRGESSPWFNGPILLDHLESVDVARDAAARPMRFPIQWVNRPNQDFRGYAGTVVSGSLAPGDSVVVLPSGRSASVARLVTLDGDLPQAQAGQAVTVTLNEQVDASRGDVIAPVNARPEVTDQFAAHVVWMDETPLLPGRPYLLRIGPTLVGAQVSELKHRLNITTHEHVAAKHLDMNEVGFCNLALDRAVPIDAYGDNRHTGGFIVIDRLTNATVGCGMVSFALRRAANVHWQALDVTKESRAALKRQKPCVLWFTGLSGAGKSTIANLVEKRLHDMGRHTYLLDGDNIRHGLNRDLGFTVEDRVENIRRIAEAAKLFVDAGLIVLTAFISPFQAERQMARRLVADGEFIEIYVDTPLDECERRDPKGLYQKVRQGLLPNFTGIDSAYEPPLDPELVLSSKHGDAPALAEKVVEYLIAGGYA